jgi:hypothetical protein
MYFNILSTAPAAVALSAGNANLAGLAINLWPNYDKDGKPTRVGPTLSVTDLPNLVAKKPDLDPAARLALFITDPTLTGNFRVDGPVTMRAATRSLLQKQYRREFDITSGRDFDITKAWTPIVTPRHLAKFFELPPEAQDIKIVNEGGQATSYLDIQIQGVDHGAFERAVKTGALDTGDGFHVGRVLPGGMTPGYVTPEALSGYMPAEAAKGRSDKPGRINLSTAADVSKAVVAKGPTRKSKG